MTLAKVEIVDDDYPFVGGQVLQVTWYGRLIETRLWQATQKEALRMTRACLSEIQAELNDEVLPGPSWWSKHWKTAGPL